MLALLLVGCGDEKVSSGDKVVVSDKLKSGDNSKQKKKNQSEKTKEKEDKKTDKKKDNKKDNEGKKSSNDFEKIILKGKVKNYDSVVVAGDSGYEIYNYIPKVTKTYVATVNKIGKALKGKAKVYGMVIPTSTEITFPDNLRGKINSSDQREAIKKIHNHVNESVNMVNIYDVLMQHRKEYIYFRTDHHWTQLGAYYAYWRFCVAAGLESNDLSQYKTKTFRGFKGSFYKDTKQDKSLKTDTVKVYMPIGDKISMKYRQATGGYIKSPVIADATNYGSDLKYVAFMDGDNAFSVINNKGVEGNKSILVVKESFGNAFVPFLADHYRNVYVVDYRYWKGSLSKFVEEKKIDDVLIQNNVSMTRNSYLIGKLAQIAK